MRALTRAEAQVIQTLVEARPSTEVELISQSEVPRSTFQYVRRRAYSRGWIFDRYVPHPRLTPNRTLVGGLVWPFSDHRASHLREWAEDPNVVVLWSGPNVVFYLAARPRSPMDRSAALRDLGIDARTRSLTISSPLDRDSIPVFFDASGALARLFDIRPPATYPISVCENLSTPNREDRWDPTPPTFDSLSNFLTSVEVGKSGAFQRAIPPIPWTLPRNQAFRVERGDLRWRVLPRLGRIPGFDGRSIKDVVFVGGTLRESLAARDLLREIVEECAAFPFLLMMGGGEPTEVFLVFLALGTAISAEAAHSSRRSVQGYLESRLSRLTIVREPVASINVIVNHRYQGLIARQSLDAATTGPK